MAPKVYLLFSNVQEFRYVLLDKRKTFHVSA